MLAFAARRGRARRGHRIRTARYLAVLTLAYRVMLGLTVFTGRCS